MYKPNKFYEFKKNPSSSLIDSFIFSQNDKISIILKVEKTEINETSLKLILSKQDKRNLLNLEKILPIIVYFLIKLLSLFRNFKLQIRC